MYNSLLALRKSDPRLWAELLPHMPPLIQEANQPMVRAEGGVCGGWVRGAECLPGDGDAGLLIVFVCVLKLDCTTFVYVCEY